MLIGNFTRNITKETKMYYVHVPKTGGTSINALFRNIFGSVNSIHHAESILLSEQHREDNSDYCRKFNFVSAHLPFDFFGVHFKPFGFRSIVTLRDPVEHFISHISHIARITNPLIDASYENMRKALQINANDFFRSSTMERLEFFRGQQTKIIFGSNRGRVPMNTLDRVSWILENYDSIFLSEDINRLDKYINVNGHKIGFTIPMENLRPVSFEIEIDITDKIRDFLQEDTLIYNEIKKINTISNSYWKQLVR